MNAKWQPSSILKHEDSQYKVYENTSYAPVNGSVVQITQYVVYDRIQYNLGNFIPAFTFDTLSECIKSISSANDEIFVDELGITPDSITVKRTIPMALPKNLTAQQVIDWHSYDADMNAYNDAIGALDAVLNHLENLQAILRSIEKDDADINAMLGYFLNARARLLRLKANRFPF